MRIEEVRHEDAQRDRDGQRHGRFAAVARFDESGQGDQGTAKVAAVIGETLGWVLDAPPDPREVPDAVRIWLDLQMRGMTNETDEYEEAVRRLIDELTGGFDYPESFGADVAACFHQRLEPAAAAEKLLDDWADAKDDARVH